MRAAALLAAATLAAPGHATAPADLGRIATALAGRPVTLRCVPLTDIPGYGGFTYASRGLILLVAPYCASLRRFAATGTATPEQFTLLTVAALALAHEAAHAAGNHSEAVAQCYGIQTIDRALRMLGASPAFARRSQLLALTIYRTYPLRYRSRDCHDGGALDLDPRSRVWP